jgi:hypothetical protein
MRKALIFQGGWDGHEPKLVSARFANTLEKHGFDAKIIDSLEPLADADELLTLDLIVACWTMGRNENALTGEQTKAISQAIARGVGLAGCHGGIMDAFRENVLWQFITGGNWVSHPGGDGVDYTVNIHHGTSPITEGLDDFPVCSEHYYLHVDPAVQVLATTRFPVVPFYHISNKPVDMPVIWTKYWGNGRVFYNSLGHHDDVFDNSPNAAILMERGMLWAADGKRYAIENNLTTERFEQSNKAMF